MNYIILTLCLAVANCRAADQQIEVVARLKALEAEVAKLPRTAPVRWATANRDEIRNALYARGREKLEEFKLAEKVSPELEAKVTQYEALNRELMNKPQRTPLPLPPRELSGGLVSLPLPAAVVRPVARPVPTPPAPRVPTPEEKEYEELVKRVAEAKTPVADIVVRRAQITARYYSREFLEQLVAEYAKDRFDLVVNHDRMDRYDKPVLYRTAAEAPDITEAILKFFRDREQSAKP